MASFVHNEPTSLTILQESGVPDAFYNAIDKGLESANEVGVRCLTGKLPLTLA